MATYFPRGTYSSGTTWQTIPLTWQQWVGGATSTGPSYTYADNSTTWNQWVTAGTTSYTTLRWQEEVWGTWIEDEAEIARMDADLQRRRDELQALREQRSREELAARQEREAQLAQARVRARELLEELVAAGDWVPGLELIQVQGSDGQLYRVEMHRETVHGNIVRVDEHGCTLGRACVAPEMYDGVRTLPNEDGWLGQYLGLKFDAAAFLSHANWSGVQGCRQERCTVPVAA